MTIPSHHTVGDAGHAADHNAIVDTLTAHDQAITALQGVTTGIFYTTGGNVSNISGTTTTWARVNLPTGNRDTAVDTFPVYHGANKVFWLDGYGHPRVKNDDPTHIPWVVDSVSGQTANLNEWRVNGAAKAWIAADGTVHAPNVTPGPWTALSLNSGIKAYGNGGHDPQYRVVGDEVQLRGLIGKTSGVFSGVSVTAGTLPVGVRPTALSYNVVASQLLNFDFSARLEVRTDGTIVIFLDSSSGYQPAWIALDNTRFSLLGD